MHKNNIYHYTTIDTLINIIERGELWLTRIDYMNDSSEYYYQSNVLKNAIDRYNKSAITNEVRKDLDALISFRDNNSNRYYSMSFSKDPDSIPMWLNYSSIDGIAIGFNIEILKEILIDIYNPFEKNGFIGEINYSKECLLTKCETYIDKLILSKQNESHTIFKILDAFGEFCRETVFYKHDKFRYEDEYRLLIEFIGEPNKDINFRASSNLIKPYYKLKIGTHQKWHKLINTIVISPLNNSDLVEKSIKEFLLLRYLNSKVEIRGSKAPLRYK